MRPRGRLGVILHTKDGFSLVPEALNGLVVQINAVNLYVIGETGGIHGEAVVLGSNFHLPRDEILHRLICAAMAKF